MSKGGRVYGPGRPGEIVSVKSVVAQEDIEFNPVCLEVCGDLRQFMDGKILASSANIIADRAERFARCQGERARAFGRTACGSR